MDLDEQYDRIFRYCYYRMHNIHIAEDITQEAFLRFFEKYKGKNSELSYLYTIARNLCIDEYRKKGREELGLSEETGFDPSEKWTDNIVLHELISKLNDNDRELLLLRFANNVPVNSISRITGLSRFAVYRKMSSILKYLRTEMEKGSDNNEKKKDKK